MRPLRLVLVALAATVAFAPLPAGAATKVTFSDPAGDAVPAGAGYDIVSTVFTTSGTTAKVGRRTVYTPTKLLVTVTYAGAVPTDAYATQVVAFDVPGCGHVYLQAYSGGTFGTADCLADPFDFSPKASGKTMTFTLPFNVVGRSYLKSGVALTGLTTYTAIADPVLGIETSELSEGQARVDGSTTPAAFKIG